MPIPSPPEGHGPNARKQFGEPRAPDAHKGEKVIAIFAPMRFKKETEDGETEDRMAFRVVHVFDVSRGVRKVAL